MKKKDKQKAGEALYQETLIVSDAYMKTKGVKTIDRQYWLFLHLGFLAGLKYVGVSEADAIEIIEISKAKIEELKEE